MEVLPIIRRELQRTSRNRRSYSIRVLAAGFAGLFTLVAVLRIGGSGEPGFLILAWYLYLFGAVGGILVTADSISEERREGTWPLLFLTQLSRAEIVLGKVLARGLNVSYCTLASLPLLATSLLAGGLLGGQVWRTICALIVALAYALATGTFASVLSIQWQRAFLAAGLTYVTLGVVPFVLGGTLGWLGVPVLKYVAAISPLKLLAAAVNSGGTHQGVTFGIILLGNVVVILLLLLVSLRFAVLGFAPVFAAQKKREASAIPQPIGNSNPVAWLVQRQGIAAWVPILLVVLSAPLFLFLPVSWGWGIFASPLLICFELLMAFHACWSFAEGRRSGALEMLFSTPLTATEILRGAWAGMRKPFLYPLIALGALRVISGLILLAKSNSIDPRAIFVFLASLYGLANLVLDFIAIGWVGLWFGLTSKKPAQGVVYTALLAVLGPQLLFCVPGFVISAITILVFRERVLGHLSRITRPGGPSGNQWLRL